MLPVAGVIIGTAAVVVVVSLAGSLVCIVAIAARPVAKPDVADGEEESAGVGAGEEPVTFIGTVAQSFTHC